MDLSGIEVGAYRLPFVRPLVTAAGTFSHREGWIVRVRDRAGRVGYGDCAPWPGFGSSLSRVRAHMAQLTGLDAAQLPEVRSAVACAVSDLEAQAQGVPLARYLSPAARSSAATHAIVSDVDSARTAVRAGFRVLKIKVATGPLEGERKLIEGIREAVGDEVRLRLDANGGWTVATACTALSAMRHICIDLVEQPVIDIAGLAQVRAQTGVPVAADECITSPETLERVIERQAADAVVLKPAFLGGVEATLKLARAATESGLKVMVTHALESAVGRAHAIHLACALTDDPVCGLSSLLTRDVATLTGPVEGRVVHPARPGLGFSPREVA